MASDEGVLHPSAKAVCSSHGNLVYSPERAHHKKLPTDGGEMGSVDGFRVSCALLVLAVTVCLGHGSHLQPVHSWTLTSNLQQALQDPKTQTSRRSLRPATAPAGAHFQDPGSSQSKQLMKAPAPALAWHFPVASEDPPQSAVTFKQSAPAPAQSVAAQCGESSVHVEVKWDFFGTGRLVNPSFLSLGGCGPVGEDPEAQVLIFECDLQDCSSSLDMTEDELIYTFTLLHAPEALAGTPIVRSEAAAVEIECHYSRLQNVSSNPLLPSWVPFSASKAVEEDLVFSLKLMTDDWMYERPSNKYFLGQFLYLEASVRQFNHVPLRIFVDSCVATMLPDVNSAPRYSFIENYGCLVDGKLTGSSSSFMHRFEDHKLRFQLEAFRFLQDEIGSVYITCSLKAAVASAPSSAENKACSFSNGYVIGVEVIKMMKARRVCAVTRCVTSAGAGGRRLI
ncbi:hypothetical protein DNTS_018579, partial [Danionella cerebrum]